jgi:hypothetical protein
MGEAKRRKAALGEKYGQEGKIFSWLPITKSQGEQFVKWTTRGAWIGIGFLCLLADDSVNWPHLWLVASQLASLAIS